MFHGSLADIMGTRLDVLIIGKDECLMSLVWDEMVSEIMRLHKMLNRFDPESDISYINTHAFSHPVKPCDELWNILTDIGKHHRNTLGFFDVTLHDYNMVIRDEKTKTVFIADKTISLDLGGYAKGYALAKMQQILFQYNITQAFINFGNSSVLALGAHPHGNCWSVGLENPLCPEKQLKVFELLDNSLSTSGNTKQHTNHIVNPHSGKYAPERRLVSIVSRDCIEAEILSTALMVADEQSSEIIKSYYHNAICCIFAL